MIKQAYALQFFFPMPSVFISVILRNAPGEVRHLAS